MDESASKRWWQLHVRVARGETLRPEESEFYDTGRRELEQDEALRPIETAREARRRLRALETERVRLENRRQQLDSEIAALESRLPLGARRLLGAEE